MASTDWGNSKSFISVTDPDAVRRAEAQRGLPGFGVLIGRERVYLRWVEDEPDAGPQWLIELGPSGRWIRQVEQRPNGEGVRSRAEDWPINPPLDLYDPKLAAMEISIEEFEDAWTHAHTDASE